jgi:hypothetical protein
MDTDGLEYRYISKDNIKKGRYLKYISSLSIPVKRQIYPSKLGKSEDVFPVEWCPYFIDGLNPVSGMTSESDWVSGLEGTSRAIITYIGVS